MGTLVISSHEDAIAAVPHVLGFHPQESLVLMPFNQELPWVRVDIPQTEADCVRLWDESLREVLASHARRAARPVGVAVLCFTSDRANAAATSRDIGRRLGAIGVRVPVRLWTSGSVWVEFNTAAAGRCSQEAADTMAATSVYGGSVRPAASREAMATSMVGDRGPVAALLKDDPAAANPVGERDWASTRVRGFLADGARLSDADAARLLVAVQTTTIRDALWKQMTRENSHDHQALWIDLTRRAPDQVRAPAATLAAFSSWLAGDGAKAWCALDQVPVDQSYSMAAVVAGVLEAALPPREWEEHRKALAGLTSDLDESFVPRPIAAFQSHATPDRGPSADRHPPAR
ncbi:hypothetical protein GCM10023339_40730 [Alloalcanivorax gelatiniphagus]